MAGPESGLMSHTGQCRDPVVGDSNSHPDTQSFVFALCRIILSLWYYSKRNRSNCVLGFHDGDSFLSYVTDDVTHRPKQTSLEKKKRLTAHAHRTDCRPAKLKCVIPVFVSGFISTVSNRFSSTGYACLS